MRRSIGHCLFTFGLTFLYICRFIDNPLWSIFIILSIALSLSGLAWLVSYDLCKKEMEKNLTETCQIPLKPKVSTVLTENLEITVKDPQGENLEISIKGRKP